MASIGGSLAPPELKISVATPFGYEIAMLKRQLLNLSSAHAPPGPPSFALAAMKFLWEVGTAVA
jgi:hypothetical protein